MELELIHQNQLATVEYDAENQIGWFTIVGLVNIELAVEAFEAYLKVLDQKPLRGAIFNCMNMKGTFTKLNPWINENWYPAIIPQGYTCWSLATTDAFSKFAGNMLINKLTPKEVTAKIFNSLEKSQEWVYEMVEK